MFGINPLMMTASTTTLIHRLAVAHETTPYVTIYDWQTGSPVKITDPAALPTGTGLGASFAPN